MYDLTASIHHAKEMIQRFPKNYWPTHPKHFLGSSSQVPIFIVGFFRSGSTLLESLLDIHPDIWGMGEMSPFTTELHYMQQEMMEMTQAQQQLLQKIKHKKDKINSMMEENEQKLLKVLLKYSQRIEKSMQERCHLYNHLSSSSKDATSNVTSASTCHRIVDKMLMNYRHIGLIHVLFPQAIILHTVRDSLDCLLSNIQHRFSDTSPYTLHIPSLVEEYLVYLQVMQHFHTVLPYFNYTITIPPSDGQKGSKRTISIRRQALIDIRYDALIADPVGVMYDLYHLLELSTTADKISKEAIEIFHAKKRLVRTASYLQVKKPVYTSSLGRWQRYAASLLPTLIQELNQTGGVIDHMRRAHSLPFQSMMTTAVPMNWYFQPEFNHTQQLEKLRTTNKYSLLDQFIV